MHADRAYRVLFEQSTANHKVVDARPDGQQRTSQNHTTQTKYCTRLTRVTVRQQLTRYYLTTDREACGTLQV